MEESCPGQGGYCDCRGPFPCRRKGRCGPWLIMVLEEAKQFILICRGGTEMKPKILCVVMLQAIINPLVVTEVEPLLLQLPLHIPVSFGNEQELRVRFLDG